MQQKIDRRGFFASLGAAMLAPLATLMPPKEKWVFNRSHALSMKIMQADGWATSMMPLSVPVTQLNTSCHNYDDGVCDIAIPGLESFAEFVPDDEDYEVEDPIQTFIVDTNEV